jgi:hypothetical protein
MYDCRGDERCGRAGLREGEILSAASTIVRVQITGQGRWSWSERGEGSYLSLSLGLEGNVQLTTTTV